MRFKSLLCISFYPFLTACTTLETWQYDKLLSDHEKGRDVCGMKYLDPFIGTEIDDLSLRDHLPDSFPYRILDPRPYLAGGPDQIITLALRPRRQNISVDADGIITGLECG